jgi:hypothetical protein
MRFLSLVGGLTLALVVVRPLVAQDVQYTAVVIQPQAEVRAGASFDARLYPTNRLQYGEKVQVLGDVPGGWLKIQPPAGSYSWINSRFVERGPDAAQSVWIVKTDPEAGAPVYVGSELQKGRPNIEGCRVTRGHLLRSVGPVWSDREHPEEGTWLPIESPPGEVRYLRAEAVMRTASPPPEPMRSSVAAVTVARPGGPAPAALPLAVPTASPQATWARAQEAERDGKEAEAIDLYQRVALDIASPPELAAQARDRAQWLRDAQRNPTSVRPPAYPAGDLPPFDASANARTYTPRTTTTPMVRLAPPCGPSGEACLPAPAAPAIQPAAYYSSGPGRLRRAGRLLDGKTAYVLDGGPGRLPLYVTAQSGIDLEPYVCRKVEIVGPSIYRGDLRANYMTASRVQPLPE